MFVWKYFKDAKKLRREKWRESIFSGCLVERKHLSPPNCFLPKWGENWEGVDGWEVHMGWKAQLPMCTCK